MGFALLRYLPLLGIAQVCLACTVRTFGWVPSRAVGVLRSMPMTAYLGYVGVVLLIFGLTSVTGVDWFTRLWTWLGIAIIMAAALVAFLWFERRPRPAGRLPGLVAGVHALASALGVGYSVLGVLGFAVTGVTWQVGVPALLGVALDPLANLIHLMLGWYLLQAVHNASSGKPGPWLLTGAACVPPIFTTWSPFGAGIHGATVLMALAVAAKVAMARVEARAVLDAG